MVVRSVFHSRGYSPYSSVNVQPRAMAEGVIATQRFTALQPAKMVLDCYLKWLGKHPVLAKAITSAIQAGAGDIVAQFVVQWGRLLKVPIHWRSVTASALFGLLVTGPGAHWFHQLLDAIIIGRSEVKKTIVSCLLYTPLYLLALLYIVALLQCGSHCQAVQRVRVVYITALLGSWLVCTVSQHINISYVPPKYHVVCSGLASLSLATFLSVLINKR